MMTFKPLKAISGIVHWVQPTYVVAYIDEPDKGRVRVLLTTGDWIIVSQETWLEFTTEEKEAQCEPTVSQQSNSLKPVNKGGSSRKKAGVRSIRESPKQT